MSEIDNSADILDVSDLTERFAELRDEQNSLIEDYNNAVEEDDAEEIEAATQALADFWHITPEEVKGSVGALDDAGDSFNGDEELHELSELLDDLRGYGGDHQFEGDWYPAILIRESHFEDYAQELLEDVGDIPPNLPGYIAIDWKKTADNLLVDYTATEIDGVTYYYR